MQNNYYETQATIEEQGSISPGTAAQQQQARKLCCSSTKSSNYDAPHDDNGYDVTSRPVDRAVDDSMKIMHNAAMHMR